MPDPQRAVMKAPAAAPDDFDLDLPAPRRATPKAPPAPPKDDFDLDLPAPKAAKKRRIAPPVEADFDLVLPSPKAKKPIAPPIADDFDLDLPAPSTSRAAKRRAPAPSDDFDLDLPVARGAKRTPPPALADDSRNPFDDLDLPVARGSPESVDLPRAKVTSVIEQADEAFGDLDLPMPKRSGAAPHDRGGFGDLDLPMAKSAVDLPARKAGGFGDIDLPSPDGGGIELGAGFDDGGVDLPTPSHVTDLPAPVGSVDLPAPLDAVDLPAPVGSVDLPAPLDAVDLPAPLEDGLDLPVPLGGADLPVAMPAGDGFDDLALPEPRARGGGPTVSDPDPMGGGGQPAMGGHTGSPTGAAGGVGYGELDLGEASADEMEFADIPQGDAFDVEPGSLPPPRAVAGTREAGKRPPVKKSKAVFVVAAFLALLVAAGAALHLTPYGAFGVYFFDRFLDAAGDPATIASDIQGAEEVALTDRWVDVRASLVTLGNRRRTAGLNRELLTRSLLHESLYEVRFGDDFRTTNRATAIALRLTERRAEGPEYALGQAADALRQGNTANARNFISHARAHDASDPYVHLIAGEIELADGALEEAAAAFALAAENGAGARGLWGVARAALRGTDQEAASAAVAAVLEVSPLHGEALAATARVRLGEGDTDGAVLAARQAVGREPVGEETARSGPNARAAAWALIGRVREDNGRTTLAIEAYNHALAADDVHVPALLGAGRVLLADRPSDALVRFDSVMQLGAAQTPAPDAPEGARTPHQEAQLGAARANIALDRVQEANTILAALVAERVDDAEVLLWAGKSEEALETPNNEAAAQYYSEAIRADGARFSAYLALAELFFATDRENEAGAVLERARANVEESAEMRTQLGEFEIRRGHHEDAIRELRRALAIEASRPTALFSLGVALRHSHQLEEAAATFERLAQVDSGHPGLALERGRLFEERGEAEEAVRAYSAALLEQPDNVGLLLRLGAAQVAAGQIDEAESTLERVRQGGRDGSAEAAHFEGRVAFARGRYAEALTQFNQAVRIDATRGEFWLYVGWAALEAGQLAQALRAEDQAIERDASLGDAFWIRGLVKLRQGQPQPALEDLSRAQQLSPNRPEILAALGEVFDELRRMDDAIDAYEQAVAQVTDNGEWYYRLGRLHMDNGNRTGAATALARATLLGEAMSPRPRFLADAHRLQADAARYAGQGAAAIVHYRRYLEVAPISAIDRAAVRGILIDLGEVPPE